MTDIETVVQKLGEVVGVPLELGEPTFTTEEFNTFVVKVDNLTLDAFTKAYVHMALVLLNSNVKLKES